MADGQLTGERTEGLLFEYLRDQAHVLDDHDVLGVADGDTRRFLTPVLHREESEEGKPCDIPFGRVDGEDPALLAG